jgi:hypothetical protein
MYNPVIDKNAQAPYTLEKRVGMIVTAKTLKCIQMKEPEKV